MLFAPKHLIDSLKGDWLLQYEILGNSSLNGAIFQFLGPALHPSALN